MVLAPKYRLRPSGAASWIRCGASVALRAAYPQASGLAAELGTAAHYVAMCMLQGQQWQAIAPNGVVITPDMVRGAQQYYGHVASWGAHLHIEQSIACHDIHPECGGTPDVWAYCYVRNIIFICDYKFGFILVDAFENWQLLCYVAGILALLRARGVDTSRTTVQFTVVQPRVYTRDPMPWIVPAAKLLPYFAELRASARDALAAEALAVVGDQCFYCDARRACVTLQKSGYRAMALSETPHVMDLSLDEASLELARIEEAQAILDSRKSGLTAQLEDAASRGARLAMHELTRVKKRETWREGMQQEVIVMGKLLGKELAEPVKAISPSKARQLGVDESVIKQYSYIPPGEQKLVRMSTTETRKIFGDN